LVDTNVVSFLMKKHPLGLHHEDLLRGNLLAISFMTVAELYEGACRANWGEKRLRKLERTVGNYTVFASTTEICRRWEMCVSKEDNSQSPRKMLGWPRRR
jgi:tRNA(fMet)-specific endonuclease VapC